MGRIKHVFFANISILHKYDYNLPTKEYKELGIKFQFYISTIIIRSGERTRIFRKISILHKYDYNALLFDALSFAIRISILHKYDYN